MIRYLKDLLHWLFGGWSRKNKIISDTKDTEPSPAASPQKASTNVDFRHLADPSQFLQELRSIEPVTKQVARAKEDLKQELRKLGFIARLHRSKTR